MPIKKRFQAAAVDATKLPPHPGSAVEACINEFGLSVAEVSVGMNITRQQLYRVMTGYSNISTELAVKLELAFGKLASDWLKLQADYDIAEARQKLSDTVIQPFTKPKTSDCA